MFSRAPKDGWQKPVYSKEKVTFRGMQGAVWHYALGVQAHHPSGEKQLVIRSSYDASRNVQGGKEEVIHDVDTFVRKQNVAMHWEVSSLVAAFNAGIESVEKGENSVVLEKGRKPMAFNQNMVITATATVAEKDGGWRNNWKLVVDIAKETPALTAVALDDNFQETGERFSISREGRKYRTSREFDFIAGASEIVPAAKNMLEGIRIAQQLPARKEEPETMAATGATSFVQALTQSSAKLRADVLLNEDNTASSLFAAIIREGQEAVNSVFRNENWEGASKEELASVLKVLPREMREAIPNRHALVAAAEKLSRAQNQQQR